MSSPTTWTKIIHLPARGTLLEHSSRLLVESPYCGFQNDIRAFFIIFWRLRRPCPNLDLLNLWSPNAVTHIFHYICAYKLYCTSILHRCNSNILSLDIKKCNNILIRKFILLNTNEQIIWMQQMVSHNSPTWIYDKGRQVSMNKYEENISSAKLLNTLGSSGSSGRVVARPGS